MSRNSPKLKPAPRPFFSCSIFRNCTQSVISPRTPTNSAAPLPTPPSPPQAAGPSSSSSSSSASHSFTQWRFPLHHQHPSPEPEPNRPASSYIDLAEAHFIAGDSVQALRLLEQSLSGESVVSPVVLAGVVEALKESDTVRLAAKILLAVVLTEGNRQAAVDAGAAAVAVETVASATGAGEKTVKERTLAALELICTVEIGAAKVRGHALAPAAIAGAVEVMTGRGRECGMGILAAMYGGDEAEEAPAEVVRAVVVALQGECSPRGRRKGAQLLRSLKERGRIDLVGDDGLQLFMDG